MVDKYDLLLKQNFFLYVRFQKQINGIMCLTELMLSLKYGLGIELMECSVLKMLSSLSSTFRMLNTFCARMLLILIQITPDLLFSIIIYSFLR